MILHLNKACYFLDHFCCVFAKNHRQMVARNSDIPSIWKRFSRFHGIFAGQNRRRRRAGGARCVEQQRRMLHWSHNLTPVYLPTLR